MPRPPAGERPPDRPDPGPAGGRRGRRGGGDVARVGAAGPVGGAAGLLVVEALGLLAVAAFYVVSLFAGHPTSRAAALWTAALAVGGAVVLVLLARALLARRTWARSPVAVVQIVLVPVGVSLALQAARPAYGVPLLVVALGVLYLLATPTARVALGRDGR
ncbi:MAG: hypothetical protein ACR2JQ_06190 [Mycobacteriales bacterium]